MRNSATDLIVVLKDVFGKEKIIEYFESSTLRKPLYEELKKNLKKTSKKVSKKS